MRLSAEDVRHLRTGALFLACAADPEWCDEQLDRILTRMTSGDGGPELLGVEDFDADALVAAVGFVNNGLPLSELRPAGDEFVSSVELLERDRLFTDLLRAETARLGLTAIEVDVTMPEDDLAERVTAALGLRAGGADPWSCTRT